MPDSFKKPCRVVLDTDAFNEVDDQFTIAYAARSNEVLKLEAIYAAPFENARSTGPADGMEKSFHEIHRVLGLVGAVAPAVLRGSESWMPGPLEAVPSEAAGDLIRRALEATPENPLTVVGIAAATNLASAILIEPKICDRIHLVWLGGHPLEWHTADEFNLRQDVHAVRVLLNAPIKLTLVPCKNVAEHLRVTKADLDLALPQEDPLCQFLIARFERYLIEKGFLSKPLWDVAALAHLIDPSWAWTEERPSPHLTDDLKWAPSNSSRHRINVVQAIKRDAIFKDLVSKLVNQ